MSAVPAPRRLAVIVPLKPPSVAKSRLSGLGSPRRRALSVAFAVDTVAAALACPAVALVVAVTDDEELTERLGAVGVVVVPERLPVPDPAGSGLNQALRRGADELARVAAGTARGAPRGPVVPVALCGDLPSLRPDELAVVLARLPSTGPGFVADAAGTGTTLYSASDRAGFDPRFGPGSRRAHLEAGAVEVRAADAPTVRRDVDTPEDLDAAVLLGVGVETARVLGLPAPSPCR